MVKNLQNFKISHALTTSRGIARIPHIRSFFPEIETMTMSKFHSIWLLSPLRKFAKYDALIGWGHKTSSMKIRTLAQKLNLPYIAVEDGFLRSFGLGVEGAPPYSLVVDRTGIYYDSSCPSDLENMLNLHDFDQDFINCAHKAMIWLRQEKLTKYNQILPDYNGPNIFRLIIDQTKGDASVILSGAPTNAFDLMIQEALHDCGNGVIAIKLHPDTLSGYKDGYFAKLISNPNIIFIDYPVETWSLLSQCNEVATISSQMGFDALMAGCRVICYGIPFYAGWGLTIDRIPCPRRTRQRNVTELFAAAYMLYARYVNPYTGFISNLEDTIEIIASKKARHP